MTTQEIVQLEDRYQLPTYKKIPIALVRGEGSYVWDAEGRQYLDYYGGHCVTMLGHSPRPVVEAIQRQAETMLFYSNVVYSDVRARAAALLAEMAPAGLQHVFFCNSGTEANETALKLARKFTGKSVIISTEGGFHGRTLGSLAVTWTPSYRAPYLDALAETVFVPFGDAETVERVLTERGDVAAVIVEPIQSMAGISDAPAAYFQALRKACDASGAMLVFDEVQTGVGRTGTFSISEQFGIRPDLISLAKSLGSGVPVGAVLASDEVAASIAFGDQGTTFGGGMLAMAAVEATLRMIRDDGLMARAPEIFERIREGVQSIVAEVRGRGCLIGLKLHEKVASVIPALRQRGVLTGGSDDPNVLRVMPPLTTTDAEIDAFLEAFEASVRQATAAAVTT
ncbi:MAG TPA: aspartate aminotransferase family protein [Rhodothermales bacterium]